MASDDASTILDVVADISQRVRGSALLVTGNFNSGLATPEGNVRDEAIASALSMAGLEDMSAHLTTRRKLWLRDGRT